MTEDILGIIEESFTETENEKYECLESLFDRQS